MKKEFARLVLHSPSAYRLSRKRKKNMKYSYLDLVAAVVASRHGISLGAARRHARGLNVVVSVVKEES